MLMASEAMGQSSHGIHEVKVVVVGNGPSGKPFVRRTQNLSFHVASTYTG